MIEGRYVVGGGDMFLLIAPSVIRTLNSLDEEVATLTVWVEVATSWLSKFVYVRSVPFNNYILTTIII